MNKPKMSLGHWMWLTLATTMIFGSIILAVNYNLNYQLRIMFLAMTATVGVAIVYLVGFQKGQDGGN